MDTQKAIEKVLQDFSRELMKVFSAAVVQAVGSVSGNARSAALPAPAARRGRPPAAAPAAPAARPRAKGRVAKVAKAAKPAPRGRPAKAAKAAGPAKTKTGPRKSTPEEVQKLADKITALLRRSAQNLSAKDMMKALGYNATDEGRFQYALNKMKDDGLVQQHGERRMARYGVGSEAAPKRPRAKAVEAEVLAVDATPVEG